MIVRDKKRAKNHAALQKLKSFEPILTEDNYKSDLGEFLNFHSAYTSNKDFTKWALQFAKKERKELLPIFKKATDFELKYIAIFKRAEMRGDFLGEDAKTRVANDIDTLIKKYTADVVSIETAKPADKPQPIKRDPQYYIQQKANNVAGEIEGAIDDFIAEGTEFSTRALLEKSEISAMVATKIQAMYEEQVKEIKEVIKGEDEQLVEGYSNFTKPKLKAFLKFLQSIVDDCAQFVQSNKVTPTRRRRKTVPPSKVVERVKFQKEFPELGLKSISPVKILEANEVWVYNTKYRRITVYAADTILQVRGTTIVGFDVTKSTTQTLRKPEDFFKGLSIGKRALNNRLKTLKTKAIKPNGRLNEDTIILGAF